MRRLKNKRHLAIVRAIVDAPIAWVSVEDLAARVGAPLDAMYDSLATLDVEGWIAPWDDGERISVTLSAYAAERFQVRLVEYGRDGTPRWRPIDERAPCPRGYSAIGGDADIELFDQMADPAPPPDIAAELAEARRPGVPEEGVPSASGAKPSHWDFPRPNILLGLHAGPFPGPSAAASAVVCCPVCGSTKDRSKVVHPRAYCLWCDRWGLDALLAGPKPATAAASSRTRTGRRPTPNLVEAQRRQRKQRRRRKHEQRWSAKAKPDARTKSKPGPKAAPRDSV